MRAGDGRCGRWRIATGAIIAAVGLAGCGIPVGGAAHPLAALPRPPSVRPSHLIVVIEENHSFQQIIGSPAAPFINQLAARGTLLTDYHAVTHPSLPNYIALLAGRTDRIRSDCHRCTIPGPTLVDQLEAHGISWAAYMEGLPRRCSEVPDSGAYTDAVDPFMHARTVRDSRPSCDRVLPFSHFGAALAAGRLPTVVFVAPNLRDDMHSGWVRTADAWLRRLIGELRASRLWREDTRVVVTFDEGSGGDARSCCAGLGDGGLVATIVAGPRVPSGRDSTPYTHYALLRSIETAFGLPFLGHAGDEGTATILAVVGTPRRARLCIPEATCRTPPMPGAWRAGRLSPARAVAASRQRG